MTHRSKTSAASSYTYSSRSSSESSSTSTSSASSSYDLSPRYSLDSATAPRVVVLRCSRCATCVETISADGKRISTHEASASGMVKFGTNLYYCDRCARMVGYK